MGAHHSTQEQSDKDEEGPQPPGSGPAPSAPAQRRKKGGSASKFTTSYVHVLASQRDKGSVSTVNTSEHLQGRGEGNSDGGHKASEEENLHLSKLPASERVSHGNTKEPIAVDGHVKPERSCKEDILRDPKKSYVDKLMEVRSLEVGVRRLNLLREEAARQRVLSQSQQGGRSVMSFLDPSRIFDVCREPRPDTPPVPPANDGGTNQPDSRESFYMVGMLEGRQEDERHEEDEGCQYYSNLSAKEQENEDLHTMEEDTWATLLENETQTSTHLLETLVKDGIHREKLSKLSEMLESETQTSLCSTKDYSVQTIKEKDRCNLNEDNTYEHKSIKHASPKSNVSLLRGKEKMESIKVPTAVPEELGNTCLRSEGSDRTVEYEIRTLKGGKEKEREKMEGEGKEESKGKKGVKSRKEETGKKEEEKGKEYRKGGATKSKEAPMQTESEKGTKQPSPTKKRRWVSLKLDGGTREREEEVGSSDGDGTSGEGHRTPSPPPVAELLQTIRESRQKQGQSLSKSSSSSSSKKSSTRVKVMFLPELSRFNTKKVPDTEQHVEGEKIPCKGVDGSRNAKDGLRKSKKLVRKHSETTESDDYYSDVISLTVRGKRDDSSEYLVDESGKRGTTACRSLAGREGGPRGCGGACHTRRKGEGRELVCAHGCSGGTCRPSRTLLKKSSSFWDGKLKRSPSPPPNDSIRGRRDDVEQTSEGCSKDIRSSPRTNELEKDRNGDVHCTCYSQILEEGAHGTEVSGSCRKTIGFKGNENKDDFCTCFQKIKRPLPIEVDRLKENRPCRSNSECKNNGNHYDERFGHAKNVDTIQNVEISNTKNDRASRRSNECNNYGNRIHPKNDNNSQSVETLSSKCEKAHRGNMECEGGINCSIHRQKNVKSSQLLENDSIKVDSACRNTSECVRDENSIVRFEHPKLVKSSQSVDFASTKGNRTYRRNMDCEKDGPYNTRCTCLKQIDSSISIEVDAPCTKEEMAFRRVGDCKKNRSYKILQELSKDVARTRSVDVSCNSEDKSVRRNRDCKKHGGQYCVHQKRSKEVDCTLNEIDGDCTNEDRSYRRTNDCKKDASYNAHREKILDVDCETLDTVQDGRPCRRSKNCKKHCDYDHHCKCHKQATSSSMEDVIQTKEMRACISSKDCTNNRECSCRSTCPNRNDSTLTLESYRSKDTSGSRRSNACKKDGLRNTVSSHSTKVDRMNDASDYSRNNDCMRSGECVHECNSCQRLDERRNSPTEDVNDSRNCDVYNVQCTYHRSESPTIGVNSSKSTGDYRRSDDGLRNSSEHRIENSSRKSSSRETVRKREEDSRSTQHEMEGRRAGERAEMVEAACGMSEEGTSRCGKSVGSSEASLVSARTARRRAEEGGRSVTRRNMEYYMEMEALGLGRILHGQWIPKDTMTHPFDKETKNSQSTMDS